MSTIRNKGNKEILRENNHGKREKEKRLEILVKYCVIATSTTTD